MRVGVRLILAALPVGAALLLPATAKAWPQPDAGDPFTMSVGRLNCPAGSVPVVLRNQTRQLVRFDLRADSETVASGSIPARKQVVRNVPVRTGSSVEIEAYSVADSEADTLIDSQHVRNDCPWGSRAKQLPFTGPPTDLLAKLATAAGLVIMGGILWWYGSIWPRSF
ncbi:hypothetical protein AB0L05_09525 [Nonomuraea pusilla]|uniref:hypothetical protein n=1 Tax=Nonomuraea pusilla TaxID=46177 RepID=UPI0033316395